MAMYLFFNIIVWHLGGKVAYRIRNQFSGWWVTMTTRHRASTSIILANISRSSYVAIATQPAHWLQIRPIVHN